MSRALALLIVAAVGGCAAATPEQQFVDDAMRSLGGRSRVEAAKTLTIEGEGVNYNLGQDMQPEAATQQFAISSYRREFDVNNGFGMVTQTRTPRFAYFQGPQPQTQVQVIHTVAFNVSPKGDATRVGAQAEFDRRMDFFHHPLTALRAAVMPDGRLGNVRSAGAARQADVTVRDLTFTITIDAAGLPVSVSHRSYHPNLGDVVMTTTFADYQDVGGLTLPARLAGTVDAFTTWELQATKQALDATTSIPDPPASITGERAAPPAPNVTAEPVGKGIWLLAGQSHHSVLVEFADHLMLIEAPQSEARTLAVIAKAKETVPNKPLTQLVTTHHHFDHTAGMRAAIAEGMNVITQAGNREWVERMAGRPHTIQPDALAKNATRLVVEPVDDEQEIRDQTQTVMLYHVAGNPHSDTMLMAYFPRDRVIVEVDAYSPGPGPHIYAANLLENIQKRKLRVDRIVPLHGTIGTFSELQKAVPKS